MNLKKNAHICEFDIDFDGQISCYTCFKVDSEATNKFWENYRNGVLTQ